MKPKEVAKMISVLNEVYLTNDGKSDVAKTALREIKNLIKIIPGLIPEIEKKEK